VIVKVRRGRSIVTAAARRVSTSIRAQRIINTAVVTRMYVGEFSIPVRRRICATTTTTSNECDSYLGGAKEQESRAAALRVFQKVEFGDVRRYAQEQQ
jgi:hypothetical protein